MKVFVLSIYFSRNDSFGSSIYNFNLYKLGREVITVFKMMNQEAIKWFQSQEKPALAWIVKQAEEAYDFQKMAWGNRYADYHDCMLFDG